MALYSRLSQFYHWKPDEIDDQDLDNVLALMAAEWKMKQREENKKKKPAGFVDFRKFV